MQDNIPKIMTLIEANTTSNRNYLLGISKFARLHGPWIFYNIPPSYLKRNAKGRLLNRIKQINASGIITCDTMGMDQIIPSHIPMVVVRTITDPAEYVSNVVPDDQKIAKMAAEHLKGCGFRNFGYCGYKNLFWSQSRGEHFRNEIERSHLEIFMYSQSRQRPSLEMEFSNLAKWLDNLPKPIGIFCCNDDRARDLIEACKICGISVPERVAIIGVDNDELICQMSIPPLTSVSMNSETAGFESAQMLHKLMNSELRQTKIDDIKVNPTYVVPRQSTDIFAISDKNTAEAIRFIRENAGKPINVDDVLSAVPLSRKVLETRFAKHLGRSIYKEIKRYRTDLIAQMLVETDLPVSEIAELMGFPDINHVSRYFQSEKNCTLRDYRKKSRATSQ